MSKEKKPHNKNKPAKTKASKSKSRTPNSALRTKHSDLRKQAEGKLKSKSPALDNDADIDLRDIVHELQVHQIELEMQNEELRTAQEDLEESRSKYADLYDFAPVGYFTFDKNGLILESNLTGAEQLVIDRSTLQKKPFSRFINRDDQDAFFLHRQGVLEKKTRQACEVRIKRMDGSEFHAQLVSAAIKDSSGHTLIRSALMNITELKKAEAALQDSELKYRHLVDNSLVGVFKTNLEGKFLFVNEAFVTMYGYKTAAEVMAFSTGSFYRYPEKRADVIKSLMNKGSVSNYELDAVTKTGKTIHVIFNATLQGDTISGMVMNITERKKMDAKLKIKQRLNELLIDSLPHSAMLVSRERKIIAANKMAREVGAMVGGYCWQEFGKCEFIAEDERKYIDKHGRAPEGGARCYFCNADEALDRREQVNIEVNAWDKVWNTCWKPLDEEIYLHYAIDITERKQAEEELMKHRENLKNQVEERTKELKDAYRQLKREVAEKLNYQTEAFRSAQLASIGELAAGVAHEINNPINGIINGAQILRNKMAPGTKEHQMASMVMKEGDRIANIVSSLLLFASGDKQKKRQVHIHDIMTDTLALSESQIRKERIKLTMNIPSALPDIHAQPQQIEQVFLNIISNARYAMNKKSSSSHTDKVLSISGEAVTVDDKPFVRVTFYDNGVGIPSEDLDKIMNPFFTTKPASEGTGLGLSISHGIISDHRGILKFDSIFGEFTRVTIDLPAGNSKLKNNR